MADNNFLFFLANLVQSQMILFLLVLFCKSAYNQSRTRQLFEAKVTKGGKNLNEMGFSDQLEKLFNGYQPTKKEVGKLYKKNRKLIQNFTRGILIDLGLDSDLHIGPFNNFVSKHTQAFAYCMLVIYEKNRTAFKIIKYDFMKMKNVSAKF